jgi:hypothetical protein
MSQAGDADPGRATQHDEAAAAVNGRLHVPANSFQLVFAGEKSERAKCAAGPDHLFVNDTRATEVSLPGRWITHDQPLTGGKRRTTLSHGGILGGK